MDDAQFETRYSSGPDLSLCDLLCAQVHDGTKGSKLIPLVLSDNNLRGILERDVDSAQRYTLKLNKQQGPELTIEAKVLEVGQMSAQLWMVTFEFTQTPQTARWFSNFRQSTLSSRSENSKCEEPMGEFCLEEVSEDELDRLDTLAKICEVFNSSFGVQEILQKAMEVLLNSTGAKRCLFLIDRGLEQLDVPAACGTSAIVNKQYSRSVVKRVKETGQAVISHDVARDTRFKDVESLKAMGVRSILCVPVKTPERDFGLIYLDNDVKLGVFRQKELRIASVIAGLAASSLAKAEYFAQMIQKEKMAALGTLLTGTIHELSNPLTSILSISELLQVEAGENELTDTLVAEARRCRVLVNQLLLTARTGSAVEFETVGLDEVVERAIQIVHNELQKHKIELVLSEEASVGSIKGNSDQLGQILLNLLFNAIYEVRELEKPRIEVRLYQRQDRIFLVVADNGNGISSVHVKRVLEPFFTTKPAGEGTGMGLAITHRLIQEHHGDMAVENSTDGGAVFTLSFPVLDPPCDVETPEAAS